MQFSCKFTALELGPSSADAVASYMSANVGELSTAEEAGWVPIFEGFFLESKRLN